MADRATVFDVVQLGVEVTPGTAVAAGKKLNSLMLSLEPVIETTEFTAMGSKVVDLVVPGKDWSRGKVTGKPTYNEITYPLASVFTKATPAVDTPVAGTDTWTFVSADSAPDTPATFTIQAGQSAIEAEQITYGMFAGFGFTVDRSTFDLTGDLIGQLFATGITMTTSPTELGLIPALPKQVSVYLDSSAAGLGTTKLTRCFRASISMTNRFLGLWPLNASLTSWAVHIEQKPTFQGTLRMELDSVGASQIAALRAGTVQFLRVQSIGNIITGSTPYTLTWDAAIAFNAGAPKTDDGGAVVLELPFRIVHDPTWGKSQQVTLINALAAL